MTFKSFYHMAYEVTKLVNGRPYRYRVRSERDPATGKTRNRWTYLGRGDGGKPAPAARPRANAREALLDALERLLDRSDQGDVTAAAVSAEAGLAHGTFYRYFKNKLDAIHALKDRLREGLASELGVLDTPPSDRAAARAALRVWTSVLLRTRAEHPGLVRAMYALAAQDPELHESFRERRAASARHLAGWLVAIEARGFVRVPAPVLTATVVLSMLDGVVRESVASGERLDEARVFAAIDLIERAVFAALD